MLRTLAVLLVLLGLTAVTPVVCLCTSGGVVVAAVPQGSAGERVQNVSIAPNRAAFFESMPAADAASADTPSLIATSAAAAIALSIATVAGVLVGELWRLPRPLVSRLVPPLLIYPLGPAWSPAVPPPR